MIRRLAAVIDRNRTCVYRGAVGWAEIRIDLLGRGLDRESIALAPVAQEMIALVSKTEHFIKSWLKMMHHKGFDG